VERYHFLLSKYISNSCSKQELNEFISWIKDSDNNQVLRNLITKDWSTFEFEDKSDSSSHEKFLELLDKVDYKEPVPLESSLHVEEKSAKSKNLKYTLLRIAVAFLLPVILGIGAYFIVNEINEPTTETVYNTITVPNGSKSKVVLSDSTIIWLNSGSTVTYPSEFNGMYREISLIGEGYFEVSENPNKPFIVKTSDIDIKVLGTKFNLKSYPEEGTIETTLLEGSVAICKSSKENQHKDIVLLKPNERATYIKKEKVIQQANLEVNETNINQNGPKTKKEQLVLSTFTEAEEFTSWKDERLVFRNINFEDICVKMERWYNVQINIHSDELKKYHYTGTLENENIVDAIKAFQITLPLTYNINHDVIDIWIKNK
jgi:ferric-dicitrate binding protein FerR (iron transport regulator)